MSLRWPNLGHPCLVRKEARRDTTFKVIFGGKDANLDMKSLLQGKLFLQTLSDTRKIFQDKPVSVSRMQDVPSLLSRRLVPISVVRVEPPVESVWHHTPIISSKHVRIRPDPGAVLRYAYWVTLRLESRHLGCLKLPQLFNLVHDYPRFNLFHTTKFHSVYVHEKEWHNFRFAHVSDPHISWRNDLVRDVIAKRMPGHPKHYINFNDNFRKFIRYANTLHRKGELDFILVTGDLIDYIYENHSRKEKDYPIDNFEVFRDLVIAWARYEVQVVGEELEVPIYTVLGNHDYRLNEYPLVFWIEAFWGINVRKKKNYGPFGLTEEEAIAFEEAVATPYRGSRGRNRGIPEYSKQMSGSFGSYFGGIEGKYPLPPHYTIIINPDANYVIPLGKHRIVCLDSGHDEGVIKDISDWAYVKLSGDESGLDFLGGSPDSVGFSKEQIAFVDNTIRQAKGLVILAFHAPALNIRGNTPHHLLRETEHNKTLTEKQLSELVYWMLQENVISFWEIGDIKKEWPLGKSRCFKVGARDPSLGKGVADHGFEELVKTIQGNQYTPIADLMLTGHTHRSIEYIVTRRGQNKFVRYYHDYYIDGSIHGESPKIHWKKNVPNYPAPLGKTKNAKEWWLKHKPLFVQTLSIGPKPSEQGEGGVLLVEVQKDAITSMERVDLTRMEKEPRARPAPNPAHLILSTSPP